MNQASNQVLYIDDLNVSEEDKQKKEYLQATADFWIARLVKNDPKYVEYRNYYNGIRDRKQFEYITANNGIGSPANLGFTNIIKPRIDSILSQLENETFTYHVNATDEHSIDMIADEKQNKRLTAIAQAVDLYIQKTETMISNTNISKSDVLEPDSILKKSVDKINKKFGESYISDYVKAAINVLKYFEHNQWADVRQKLKLLLLDLLVTGEAYYRIYTTRLGSDPIFEVIKPENFFHNKNTNNQYIGGTNAVVHREYLTRHEILQQYGKFMTKEQKEELTGPAVQLGARTGRYIATGADLDYYSDDINTGYGRRDHAHPLLDTVEVFHTEWLAVNEVTYTDEDAHLETLVDGDKSSKIKKGYRIDRYEVTRIGGSIYLNAGKSKYISRSQSTPFECYLTYDGIRYNDRGGTPFSLVGGLKDLQDAYDITIYHRDNLMANSGVPGDRINLAAIPKVLGSNFMDRLLKFVALKKNGVELIDPTEPGATLFQHYGSFDNTVQGNALQAINAILEMITYQADIVAGTNQQMLGQIAERDAVTNVKVGIQQSLMRNQDMFELFRTMHSRMLNKYVGEAQIAFSTGMKGSYVAGPYVYTFKIDPTKFIFTDYSITVSYSSKDDVKLSKLQELAKEFASAGTLPPDILTSAVLSDSVIEAKRTILDGYAQQKEENDQLQQASQQIQSLTENITQLQQELQKVTAQLEKLQGKDLDLKEREVNIKAQLAENQRILKDKELNLTDEHYERADKAKDDIVNLEREQLYLETGPAKEVNNKI
jgi:hypothetical protein